MIRQTSSLVGVTLIEFVRGRKSRCDELRRAFSGGQDGNTRRFSGQVSVHGCADG